MRTFCPAVALSLSLFVGSCWQSQQVLSTAAGDSDSDSDADGDADSDSDSDGDTDTQIQGPVTFILTNADSSEVYLDWSSEGAEYPMFRPDGSETESEYQFLQQPWCTVLCADIEEGENCCMDCSFYPAVRVLPPGESFYFEWDGKFFHHDAEQCSECSCFYPGEPSTGAFEVLWKVYEGFDCLLGSCEPDENNIIVGAQTVAEPYECYSSVNVIIEEPSVETVFQLSNF